MTPLGTARSSPAFSAGSRPALGLNNCLLPAFPSCDCFLRKIQLSCIYFCVSFPEVSFAQQIADERITDERDEVTLTECLADGRTEKCRGGRRGELNSLAGEATERGVTFSRCLTPGRSTRPLKASHISAYHIPAVSRLPEGSKIKWQENQRKQGHPSVRNNM